MRGMRMLAIAFGLCASLAQAYPDTPTERVYFFAQCTGRLSAELEHGWVLGQHDAELEAQRNLSADVLAALREASAHEPRDVLALRIETKLAHERLLNRATFQRDERARRHAARLLAPCRALLLG